MPSTSLNLNHAAAPASASTSAIKLTHAALDEHDGEITLRGIIAPESLAALKIADYQREILPGARARDLQLVLASGATVPDITLGMRGGQFSELRTGAAGSNSSSGGTYLLEDRVFIIDGLQRTTAALSVLHSGGQPRLGAIVYFNTTEQAEREMFRQLNTLRSKLSPNVLLYNERHTNPQIRLLFDLCQDSSFALYQRVSWKQLMRRTDLLNAVALVGTAAELHQHFGVQTGSYRILKIAESLGKVKLPRTAIRDNVKAFWDLLDFCWKIRDITYKPSAPHIKRNFLQSLCAVLTRHQDFWKDSEFYIAPALKRKLASFPLQDPSVAALCSAGGSASSILYPVLVEHLNSGKRTGRLRLFNELPRRLAGGAGGAGAGGGALAASQSFQEERDDEV